MKPLILLLVLFSAGMGQTTITNKDTTLSIFAPISIGKIFFDPAYWFTLPKDSTRVCLDDTCFYTRENIYVAIFLFRYTQPWKEYKQECWNDSTVILSNPVIDWKKTKELHGDKPFYSYVVTKTDTLGFYHRTPTSDGFINWMEKKSPR